MTTLSNTSTRHALLPLLGLLLLLAGCTDSLMGGLEADAGRTASTETPVLADDAPRSEQHSVLRHPQMLDMARGTAPTGTHDLASATNGPVFLYLAFQEYEADGVTPRILDQYGITRRILEEYGITRRILEEYGITRRILEEYGITRRILEEYGLTMDVLEEHGITRRILEEYGVSREELEARIESFKSVIKLRLRVSKARPGMSIKVEAPYFETILDELAYDPDIAYAEPDASVPGRSLDVRDGFNNGAEMIPWSLQRIGGVFTTFSNSDVRVYTLDSGIYDRDLNVVEQKDFTMLFQNREQDTMDEDAILNMGVFNPGEDGNPADESGHGTHVAGILGAKANTDGIRGVARDVKLHSLKVLTDEGRTDITTVMAAIDYVTDQKQRNPLTPMVMNLSLGLDLGTTAYNVLDEAVQRTVANGVVVVVSAGNDGMDAATVSPAHVAEAITVGAYDQQDRYATWSNYGPVVDLLAPGDLIVSLTHLKEEADQDENIVMSGTSHAAPHVAGAAALYLAQHPEASPAEVKQALINHAKPGINGTPQGTTDRTVYVGEFAGDGDDKPFKVSKAEWKVNDDPTKSKLVIEGEGPRLQTVDLLNGATTELIARLTIEEDSKWKLEQLDPENVPCSVLVSFFGETTQHEVQDAPGDCDQPLAFRKAKWDDGKRKLEVEGHGPKGYDVAISDAVSGQHIVTLSISDKGEFKFKDEDFPFAPCAVRVQFVDLPAFIETQVEDAAASCYQEASAPAVAIGFTEASWDKENDKLRLNGTATPGVQVTLMSDASGTVLATPVANDKGEFKVTLEFPALIPCTARLETAEGDVAVANVLAAPNSCERPFQVDEIKWKDGTTPELEIKGYGVYNGTFTLANGWTGEVFFTGTIDDKGKADQKIQNPSVIPCSVIATSEGRTVVTHTVDVVDAPFNCDVPMSVNTLNWVPSTTTLEVGGIATGGSTVRLLNPDNGTEIASLVAGTNRDWRVDLDLSASGGMPPCRVRVVAVNGEETHTLGGTCDPAFVYTEPAVEEAEQNPYSFVGIDKVEWRDSENLLRLQGTGYVFMDVVITNATLGTVLGTTTTTSSETWYTEIPTPGIIPCSVTATLDGRTATMAVANAPLTCDEQAYVEWNRAEWDAGNQKLKLEGFGLDRFGNTGQVVTFSNATTGEVLTTVTTDDNGEWQFEVFDVTTVPCTIEASIDGATATLPVKNAPLTCDEQAYVEWNRAEWDAGNQKLKLEGFGLDRFGNTGQVVTFSNATTGEVLTTVTTDDNGEWQFEVFDVTTVPCTIEASIDGATATLPVKDAPAQCQ